MSIIQATCLLQFFRAQKTLKAAVETHADVATESRNPFQQRPSSSRAASLAAASLEKAMIELDDEQHMPDSLNFETWKKLVAIRRIKVEKEQQVDYTICIVPFDSFSMFTTVCAKRRLNQTRILEDEI